MEFDIDLSNPITINNQYGMLFYKEENKSQSLTWGDFYATKSK